jgi:hypothetical protein
MNIQTEQTVFEPEGAGSFPRISILRMDKYQPGLSRLDHYRVETTIKENNESAIEEFQNWSQVTRAMDARYEGKFSKQFPGAAYIKFDGEEVSVCFGTKS